jgi:hypothetical protein
VKRPTKFGTVKSTQKGVKLGTISYYGPKPGLALKVSAGIATAKGVQGTRAWRSATDVRYDVAIASQVATYLKLHGVRAINFVDAVIDCVHEDRNICGCDDSIFKKSGADPMYTKDGIPGNPEDKILVVASRVCGATVYVSSHLDFHQLRDAKSVPKGRTFYIGDSEEAAKEIAKNYEGTSGDFRLWLQRAYTRTSENSVAATRFAGHQTHEEVENVTADIAEIFIDQRLVTVGGGLWQEPRGAKVGVIVTVLPGRPESVVHVGITRMENYQEFTHDWMLAIEAAGDGKWDRLFRMTRMATVSGERAA